MAANNRRISPADVADLRRTDAQVHAWVREAFVHAMAKAGASHRSAARWMRVAPSTVLRWVNGKVPVNPLKVFRSRRLAHHFLICLRIIDRRGNGR